MRRVQATPKLIGSKLAVNEVFGPTFQGEGPTSGRRAAFLRLARCNLSCTWCDTAYTWDWSRYEPRDEVHRIAAEELLSRIAAMGVDRLVITGGEPLLQQAQLLELLEACATRWTVEIETNGTRAPLPATAALVDQFNVAIKLANSGMAERARVRPAAIRALLDTGRAVFKFVVEEPQELDEVAGLVDRFGLEPVWIMPQGTTPEMVVEGVRRLSDPVLDRGWNMTSRLHVLAWGSERGR
jgi:7-carboxy-7-deazaguanine synthase